MAKAKLFPRPPASTTQDPHQKFSDFAAQIIKVPKSAIEQRDERWQKARSERKG